MRQTPEPETRDMPGAVRDVYDPLNKVAITTHYHWQLMLQLYDGEDKEPRKNNLSKFPGVGQPPSAVIKPGSRGRLPNIQDNASAELINLFVRGA
jgi:hypothetical protein